MGNRTGLGVDVAQYRVQWRFLVLGYYITELLWSATRQLVC
jgi:hypothetical protein